MNLALKCVQNNVDLEKTRSLLEKFDLRCIEIHELFSIIGRVSTEKRSELVVRYLKDVDMERIAYHFPIRSRSDSFVSSQYYDLAYGESEIVRFVKDTIREAAVVAEALEITYPVPIVVHTIGFTEKDKISIDTKEKVLSTGENVLISIKEYANRVCRDMCLMKNNAPLIRIVRENSPPEHGTVDGVLDFHPMEIVRTAQDGIGNCLDLANYQQYMNYLKHGKGELPGVDLDREWYPTDIDWGYAFEQLSGNIAVVHVNDASGFRKEGEGLEVGAGEIDFDVVIPLMKNLNGKSIFTIEIKDGYINWWKVENSIRKIRKMEKEF